MFRTAIAAACSVVACFPQAFAAPASPRVEDISYAKHAGAEAAGGLTAADAGRHLQYGASASPISTIWPAVAVGSCDGGTVYTSGSVAQSSRFYYYMDVPAGCHMQVTLRPVAPSGTADVDLMVSLQSDFNYGSAYTQSSALGGSAAESVTISADWLTGVGTRWYIQVTGYTCPAYTCYYEVGTRSFSPGATPTPTPTASRTPLPADASASPDAGSGSGPSASGRIPSVADLQCSNTVSTGASSATITDVVSSGTYVRFWFDAPAECSVTVTLRPAGLSASGTDVDLYVDASSTLPYLSAAMYSSAAFGAATDTVNVLSSRYATYGTRWYVYVKGYTCPSTACSFTLTVATGTGTPAVSPSPSPLPLCTNCVAVRAADSSVVVSVAAGGASSRFMALPLPPNGDTPFTFTVSMDVSAASVAPDTGSGGRLLQNGPALTSSDVVLVLTASNQPFGVTLPPTRAAEKEYFYATRTTTATAVGATVTISSFYFDTYSILRTTFLHQQVYINLTTVVGTGYGGALAGLRVTAPVQLTATGPLFSSSGSGGGGGGSSGNAGVFDVGGLIGGLAVATAIAGAVVYRIRRRAAKKKKVMLAASTSPAVVPGMMPGGAMMPGMMMPGSGMQENPMALAMMMQARQQQQQQQAGYPVYGGAGAYPPAAYPGYSLQMQQQQQPPPPQQSPYSFGPTTVSAPPTTTSSNTRTSTVTAGGTASARVPLPPPPPPPPPAAPPSEDPVPTAPAPAPPSASPSAAAAASVDASAALLNGFPCNNVSTGFGMFAAPPQPGQQPQATRIITMVTLPRCGGCGAGNVVGVAWGCGAAHGRCSTCAVRSMRSEMAATRALWPVHCPDCRANGAMRVINTVAAAQVIHASRSSNDASVRPFDGNEAQMLLMGAQGTEMMMKR